MLFKQAILFAVVLGAFAAPLPQTLYKRQNADLDAQVEAITGFDVQGIFDLQTQAGQDDQAAIDALIEINDNLAGDDISQLQAISSELADQGINGFLGPFVLAFDAVQGRASSGLNDEQLAAVQDAVQNNGGDNQNNNNADNANGNGNDGDNNNNGNGNNANNGNANNNGNDADANANNNQNNGGTGNIDEVVQAITGFNVQELTDLSEQAQAGDEDAEDTLANVSAGISNADSGLINTLADEQLSGDVRRNFLFSFAIAADAQEERGLEDEDLFAGLDDEVLALLD